MRYFQHEQDAVGNFQEHAFVMESRMRKEYLDRDDDLSQQTMLIFNRIVPSQTGRKGFCGSRLSPLEVVRHKIRNGGRKEGEGRG